MGKFCVDLKKREHLQAAEPIITNVTFSPEVAAALRAKEVRAFVPVSAAELIWLEALSVDDGNEDKRGTEC